MKDQLTLPNGVEVIYEFNNQVTGDYYTPTDPASVEIIQVIDEFGDDITNQIDQEYYQALVLNEIQ